MKKILLSAALVLVATSAFAVISGTKHDFKAGNTAAGSFVGTSDQTCKYCHVPHNATLTNLLWSRTAGTAPVATAFYDSATMDAIQAAATTAPQSTLCLSCHNSTPGTAGTSGVAMGAAITGSTKLILDTTTPGTTDLSNDHPIGFAYNAALVTADPTLKPVATVNSKETAGVSGTLLPLFGSAGTATLECATCHAVHGGGNGPGGNPIAMFLRTTNSGSVLCLKCHIK